MCQSIFTSVTCTIKFDPVKFQACGFYTNGDKTYYDGFVTGYMQIGKTKLISEAVVDILNMKTQPTQANSGWIRNEKGSIDKYTRCLTRY